MRMIAAMCAVLLVAAPAAESSTRITCYLDGARVESEAAAVKGVIEIPLPRGMAAESLRLKPVRGATISRVEFTAAHADRKREKEMARLTGRKNALADRLQALEVKEEIFRAAAKSQSGKAPRSSKNNREPLENIRKGTAFALAQLEEVYTARRTAENELKSLEARLSSLNDAGNHGGRIARVWLAGKNGRVAVSYLLPGLKWTPSYDFRLNSNREVEVTMRALLTGTEKGVPIAVVPALLPETTIEAPIALAPDGSAKVAVFRFPLEKESYSPYPASSLSFTFRNLSEKKLPPGESTCYRQGEYIGKIRFDGSLPGESKTLDFGKVILTVK
jgi:hypothetical protein